MNQLVVNKLCLVIFSFFMSFLSNGQTTISYNVKNIETVAYVSPCAGVKLVVEYSYSGASYFVSSPIYYIPSNQTQELSVTLLALRGITVVSKKLVFDVGSHVLTYVIPASGAVSQDYYGLNPCEALGSSSGSILMLGGNTSLITFFINYALGG